MFIGISLTDNLNFILKIFIELNDLNNNYTACTYMQNKCVSFFFEKGGISLINFTINKLTVWKNFINWYIRRKWVSVFDNYEKTYSSISYINDYK